MSGFRISIFSAVNKSWNQEEQNVKSRKYVVSQKEDYFKPIAFPVIQLYGEMKPT